MKAKIRTLELIINEADRPENKELDEKIINIINVEPPPTNQNRGTTCT